MGPGPGPIRGPRNVFVLGPPYGPRPRPRRGPKNKNISKVLLLGPLMGPGPGPIRGPRYLCFTGPFEV